MRRAVAVLLFASIAGCASLRPMVARSGDLEDYRSFRVAAAQGTRLARAQKYLERHPDGAFADEVRSTFETEEPRYFAAAQESREAAIRYLVDLPKGPHAEAAVALVQALSSNMAEAELGDIARKARLDETKLEAAAVQRRAVGEAILTGVGVLLDEDVYGVSRAESTPELRRVLLGNGGPTWGALPSKREEDLFFLLPTRPERESRVLTLVFSVEERDGLVVAGTIEATDMFVRWAEADMIQKLDPSSPEDRTEAQIHCAERLSGALERRFPAASCEDKTQGRELHHRACAGWEIVVIAGSSAGDVDRIVVRGRARKARETR